MDARILQALQNLSDPGELAGGIASFFKKHTSRVREIFNKIITQTPADPDTDVTSYNLGTGPLVLSNTDDSVTHVDLQDLGTVLAQVANNDETISKVPVTITNQLTQETTLTYMDYDQVIELIREQSDLADGLITTLSSYQDWINNPDLNFEQLTLERVNNLLPTNSSVCEKLKQGISSISTRFVDNIREYSPSVLHNIMSLFGVDGQDYSTESVASFEGVNAWTVILGDVIDGINYAINKVPQVAGRLFATIGYAIAWLIFIPASKLASAVESAVISFTGADNAFKATMAGGDRTVSSCDWRYTADKSYTVISGSPSFDQLINDLDELWSGREYQEISIPLFAGVFNMQKLTDTKTGFNLRVKPLNVTAVNVAWNKTMGNSHLYYNLVQDSPGLISRNSHQDDYPLTLTRDDLINFFNEISNNPELYYFKSWKTDADAFMACQCGKIVCFLQLLLMMDTIPSPPGFIGMLLNCSDLADFYIEGEPNYTNGSIEPSNYNMLRYLSSLKSQTSAFNTGSGRANDYAPTTSMTISQLDMLWRFVSCVVNVIIQLDVLSTSSLDCFLPYQTSITYKKSSFYIPSDSDNIDLVKGIIKTGLAVAGVAVVVLTSLFIRGVLKKKAFSLEAQAGSLSWNASETGNINSMKKAYKLSKRANLLSKVAGTASSSVSQTVNSLIDNNSGSNITLVEIRQLIKSF